MLLDVQGALLALVVRQKNINLSLVTLLTHLALHSA